MHSIIIRIIILTIATGPTITAAAAAAAGTVTVCTRSLSSDSSAKVRSVLYFGSGPTMQRFLYCTPYEVSCLLGLVLPTASRVVKTRIEKCLCISTASKVSFGWMRYASGTTLSKKTLSILGSMVSDGLCRRHSAARACWRRDCVSAGSGTSVLAVSASMSSPSSSKSGSRSC